MIWLFCFTAAATVGNALCGALGSRLGAAHVLPNACLVVMVFISLRREPLLLALAAFLLGGVMTRDSLAPLGLHATALLITALATYLLAGSLAAEGTFFFGLTCAVAATFHEALLYVLLLLQAGRAHFASWAAATLVLTGLCTGLLGLLAEPLLRRLDLGLSPKRSKGLIWRS